MRRPPLVPLLVVSAILLAGCVPEPVATAPPETGSGQSPSTASPTPLAPSTETPVAVPLPPSCEDLYSEDLIATLTLDIPPLGDPALADFLSTENVTGLEVLESGVPSLRCTWGAAGTPGLATTVARVAGSDADEIRQSLIGNGFACGDLQGGTVCRLSQEMIDQSDRVRTNGETHWFGNGFWAATHWVDYDPDGYTRDIAGRLAG